MKKLNMILAQRVAVLLLLSFAVACGETDDAANGSSSDGASLTDGAGAADGSADGAGGGATTDAGDGATGGTADGADSGPVTTPAVVSTTPGAGATQVTKNAPIGATFSEPMDPETLTNATFGLTTGEPPVAVDGTVIYSDGTCSGR